MRIPTAKSKSDPTEAAATVMARPHFPAWLLAVLLALVTIALYWPATRCDFVSFDDRAYVTENIHVQSGLTWEGVKWAFRDTEQAIYWAPLMWLSHMLVCQFFGLNPWGHHLINVLLHAANTALVFLLFRRMTGATWRSLIMAALFGLHPLRVESVAWVSERKDVLSTLFFLLTLWAYAQYVSRAKRKVSGESQTSNIEHRTSNAEREELRITHHTSRYYFLALFCFALGLMSKPMLVTLPFVLLLLDYWPLCRFKPSTLNPQPSTIWRLVREKIPFFALAAAASIVTFMVQKHGGVVKTVENFPLGARVGNALISCCRYLEKLFWPTDLAVFYPHPGYWPMAKVLLAGGLVLGITVLLFVKGGRYPFMLMGWLWFCGTLVPVIGLVQVGEQAMADRYAYIPSLGILILAVWGAYELTRRWRDQVMALSVAGCVIIILCLGLTRQQLGYWQDSETLFRHALEVTKNNYVVQNNLGAALDGKGQSDEAIGHFQEAIRLKPDYAEARNNFGVALNRKGQTDEAIGQFQEAVRLKPNNAGFHYNLGIARGRKGQIDEAISQFQEAVRLKPDLAGFHYNLGVVLGMKGQTDEAISQFQETIRLKPDLAEAHNNLGTALDRKGQTDEAIRQFQEAIRLKPDYIEAHYNFGIVLLNKGQTDEAIRQFQEIIRLKPDYTEAQRNLARALEIKNAPAGR